VYALVHLCNLIMGVRYYVSLVHFQMNYCLGTKKVLKEFDVQHIPHKLSEFYFMLFD
jgi:hypothetical protein